MTRLRTFIGLSGREQWLLLQTGLILVILEGASSLLSFTRLRGVANRFVRIVPSEEKREITPTRITWAVETIDRIVPGSRTCLLRSLTTVTLLRQYGYSPIHYIGVARDDAGRFEAHSWVEYEGEILVGEREDLDRYATFSDLQSGA